MFGESPLLLLGCALRAASHRFGDVLNSTALGLNGATNAATFLTASTARTANPVLLMLPGCSLQRGSELQLPTAPTGSNRGFTIHGTPSSRDLSRVFGSIKAITRPPFYHLKRIKLWSTSAGFFDSSTFGNPRLCPPLGDRARAHPHPTVRFSAREERAKGATAVEWDGSHSPGVEIETAVSLR